MSEPIPTSVVRALIRSTSMAIGCWHPAAEELLLMIAAHESHMGKYLRQVGGGPALGIWQMEPATYEDCWKNVVPRKPYWAQQLTQLGGGMATPSRLANEHALAAAMARLQIWRHAEALPDAGNLEALGRYAKKYWNGPGKATSGMYVQAYRDRVA